MRSMSLCFFFFNDTATTEIYTLSLHDALPIFFAFALTTAMRWCARRRARSAKRKLPCCGSIRTRMAERRWWDGTRTTIRSEEHTSELQSQSNLVCRLLLEKKHQAHSARAETQV